MERRGEEDGRRDREGEGKGGRGGTRGGGKARRVGKRGINEVCIPRLQQ